MFKYTLRKFFALIPKLLLISLLLFIGQDALPGDALTRNMSPMDYNALTEWQREQAREEMGLNDPAPQRYIKWIGRLLQGDLGYSSTSKNSIAEMLADRLPETMLLAITSLLIAYVLGILGGVLCALHRNSILDQTIVGITIGLSSIPGFFLGLCLLVVFSLNLGWFPTGGRFDPFTGARLPYLVLPLLSLTLSHFSGVVRYTRTYMLDVMNKDYVKTARLKGIKEYKVIAKHVLRIAIIPLMTGFILDLPGMLSGSMVIEQIFNYPGMGELSVRASGALDIPVIMILTMVSAVSVIICSAMVDLVIAMLDPRVRLEN